MLRELESKTDQVASSIHSLPAKLQQTATQSQEIYNELPEVKSAVTNLGASMTRLSTEIHGAVSLHDQRLQGLEVAVNNMSSSLDTIPSQLQQTVTQEGGRMTSLEQSVTRLSTSMNAMSSDLQEKDQKLMTALANLTAEILSIKQHNVTFKNPCQSNWIAKGSSCYLFSSNKLAWHAARDYCRTQGGLLLILNDAEEWTFITTNSVPEYYWVGLTDEINEVWRWVDGTPLVMDKSQWEPGQPDNWTHHGLGGGEDCASLEDQAKLNDAHCIEPRRYICEKAAAEV
ncbi:C-type lectin domain family 10 member A-like [Engraulis encrasicolus]|uniref:C-type lectin domain family 10 member A-like n=1 Tax=Engraulis encrasicolus TaxID=184585 RepID=UPI002FD2D3B6